MSNEELSEAQNQLLATYGGTNIETLCREMTAIYGGTNIETISRELSAIDDLEVDPDFRPRALWGLPWWTMKIPKAIKYRPLLEKAWDEGHEAASTRVPERVWHDTASPRTPNPYRQEPGA